MTTFKDARSGAAIKVKVMPRAKKNAVAGKTKDGIVKIKLTAPPVDGAANDMLIEFLAETLDLPQRNVEIVSGLASEHKLIAITGITPQALDEKLGFAETDKDD